MNKKAKKVSNGFSGALRTLAHFMSSGGHYMLRDTEYMDLYGEYPGVFEMAYAIFANVVEMDDNGEVLNFTYAQKRATDYIKTFCDPNFQVNPPFEDWETTLYNPPSIKDKI